jgi:hypothetical protein
MKPAKRATNSIVDDIKKEANRIEPLEDDFAKGTEYDSASVRSENLKIARLNEQLQKTTIDPSVIRQKASNLRGIYSPDDKLSVSARRVFETKAKELTEIADRLDVLADDLPDPDG